MAADYVELVRQDQGSEQERAALEKCHQDAEALVRLKGEFGALLPAGYLTVVPDEHTECDSGHVLRQLVTAVSRYPKRWCYSGGSAQAARITTGFLIQCMQEADQVHQFLSNVRGDAPRRPRLPGDSLVILLRRRALVRTGRCGEQPLVKANAGRFSGERPVA
ncbi:hypothetical protein AB0C61_14445 [Streptomyces sp. NPDC048680]|uniref:hypothetical protein n=1 Tax=Streptomyces sp. NPDC048680 TaxID=3155492 RepID=UPI0034241B84